MIEVYWPMIGGRVEDYVAPKVPEVTTKPLKEDPRVCIWGGLTKLHPKYRPNLSMGIEDTICKVCSDYLLEKAKK